MSKDKHFIGIGELIKTFSSELSCIKHLANLRWNGKPKCPYCKHDKVYVFTSGKKFKCASCRKIFSVRVGTIFEDSKISLKKWFIAIYLEANHKKGISSHQLHRDVGVTQKTAWFMLHRIREAIRTKTFTKLSGIVEIDETFIGGKFGNMHRSIREKFNGKFYSANKTTILGLLQRNGNVLAIPIPKASKKFIVPLVHNNIEQQSILYTDGGSSYVHINPVYKQHSVIHKMEECVRGDVHTNSMEGFWSQLKRGIIGIYHHISPKHLSRYCDEFTFRYNTRKINNRERFNLALQMSNGGLTYKNLIRK